jgi:hypothetical protein
MSVSISQYILTRLTQLGVKNIFGVPGDFNLAFLDYIEDSKDLDWVGCCNELNAAYAADGRYGIKWLYAKILTERVRRLQQSKTGPRRPGDDIRCRRAKCRQWHRYDYTSDYVLVNIADDIPAGSFSERIPVLHIVGVPSTKLQAHKAILHHTLGDGRRCLRQSTHSIVCSQVSRLRVRCFHVHLPPHYCCLGLPYFGPGGHDGSQCGRANRSRLDGRFEGGPDIFVDCTPWETGTHITFAIVPAYLFDTANRSLR